ncbi:2,3,4,5-tetrahydropyridine-2,6-dicarboxylate N-succinyltransferase [Gammaproteobacteria bacterium]|nr:2,3,4,5-tetrahydropyridine-2,6-dicarboxylate N-succinyltransferase [Gammaproteobacteria bacterium]
MTAIHSYGFGLATENSSGEIIEVYYPHFGLDAGAEFADEVLGCCGLQPGASGSVILDEALRERLRTHLGALASSEKTLVLCVLGADIAPATVAEAFLKLHLLSARLVKPHALNLNGMFGVLHNLAWTNEGPIDLSELPDRQLAARLQGRQLSVTSVDKFPKMSDYIVPTGVRIADSARVRLGAYLGEGTTVMHEGFINFNAGTEGPAMIEGRISAGVMVGASSDLGGGCSTMGTLSGGGKQVISVGENCLIGANAGIGIPLANGCVVEAGLYVTAGTKVQLLNTQGELKRNCKAMDLVGHEGLLFRRNSLSGAVECLPLQTEVELNEELHAHN